MLKGRCKRSARSPTALGVADGFRMNPIATERQGNSRLVIRSGASFQRYLICRPRVTRLFSDVGTSNEAPVAFARRLGNPSMVRQPNIVERLDSTARCRLHRNMY
jgi:hypothetical protein